MSLRWSRHMVKERDTWQLDIARDRQHALYIYIKSPSIRWRNGRLQKDTPNCLLGLLLSKFLGNKIINWFCSSENQPQATDLVSLIQFRNKLNGTSRAIWATVCKLDWVFNVNTIYSLSKIYKNAIRRWDSEREFSLSHRTRITIYKVQRVAKQLCVGTWNAGLPNNSVKKTHCSGHYAVQGYSRSPSLVPIESSHATFY